jgi:hypothetical protein
MTSKLIRALAGVTIAVASMGGTARADVSQTPLSTACPAGYEHLSVGSLEAAGPYRLPRRFDASGNNNGSVCALEQPDSVRDAVCKNGGPVACILAQLGLPIYRFIDDDNPASQRAQIDE